MKKKIHIEINYTIPDTSKFCDPIIETKIEGEEPDYIPGLLNSTLLYLTKEKIYEDEKEHLKDEIKKEVIKDYLQNLLEVVK